MLKDVPQWCGQGYKTKLLEEHVHEARGLKVVPSKYKGCMPMGI